jgi:polygalacturonase
MKKLWSFLAVSLVFIAALHYAGRHAGGTFEVRTFGAVGDGKTLDTAAIQGALDRCGRAGGGIVHFAPGTYLTKPLFLSTKTTLQIDPDAKLIGTDEPSDYFKFGTNSITNAPLAFNGLINGTNLTNITITGGGTIDGAGARWWVPAEAAREKTPGYSMPRPRMISIVYSRNVRVTDVTLQNSPSYHFVPMGCENVVVSNVTILAPERSPNTDAIDPSACKNVLITKCHIDVGDDNVAIKSPYKVPGREFACEDITVTDCVFLHGHGMSIGSDTTGGVHNVNVRNCVFANTENGLRIKSQRGRGGLVEDINYSDLVMTNVDPAITFTCYYQQNSAGDATQKPLPENDSARPVRRGTPVFRNIHVSNVTATCQKSAGTIVGLPESLVSNVVFSNVQITAARAFRIENASGIQFKDSHVSVQRGEAFALKNATVEGVGKE